MSGFLGGFGVTWIVASASLYFSGTSGFEATVVQMLAAIALLLTGILWHLDMGGGNR